MPSTKTKTTEEQLAELEQKVEDLAGFVGRLTAGVLGDDFGKYDPGDDELLVWREVVSDPGTEDEALCGWWEYEGAATTGEASVDA